MKQGTSLSCINAGTIAITLTIINFFLIISLNLGHVLNMWRKDVRITLYLEDDLTLSETTQAKNEIAGFNEVDDIRYISQEEAFLLLKKNLDSSNNLLDGFGTNILPSSFEVRLKEDVLTSKGLEDFVAKIEKVKGIEEINYDSDLISGISTFFTVFKVGNLTLGVMLCVATVFIVSNIIGLSVYARREELEVMKLMGATNFFIKTPFLLEGLIQGLLGSVFSLALLYGIYKAFISKIGLFLSVYLDGSDLLFLPLNYIILIVICGMLLGIFGSTISLRRFLKNKWA